jgi:HEAT repeat protein
MDRPPEAAVELLRQTDNPAADQLLLAMLGTDDPAAQIQAIDVILDRGWTPGMVEIVARFGHLRADVQALAIARARDVTAALRKTIRDNRTELRVHTVEIIRRSCDSSLAYLLSIALRDGHTGIRRAAAEGLETFVRNLLHDERGGQDGPAVHWRVRREGRRRICDALADGMESYDVHGEQTVIRAAMLLADPACGPLWKCLERHRDIRGDVILELLADSDDPQMVDFYYQALALGHHRGRLLSFLRRTRCGPFFKAVLANGCLVLMPKVAESISRLRKMELLEGPIDWLDELPLNGRRHLARLILATGLPDEQKLAVLGALAESADPAERLDALIGILQLPGQQADRLVKGLLTDPDEQVQRIATRGVARRRSAGLQQMLLNQLNSPFESVRRLASARLATFTFERYWEAFDRLSPAQRLAGGRALVKLDPSFEDRLRTKLVAGDEGGQMRAMAVISLLGLEPACAQQLVRLSNAKRARIRATAVKLLGRIHSPDALDCATAALGDVDPRVQANAVESLEQQGGEQMAEKVRPMLEAADNRLVANAAKALAANLAEVLPVIHRLLRDARPEHRLSGLWVVGQLKLPDLLQETFRLCRTDENHRVRNRAIEVLTSIRNSLSQEGKA